MRFSNIPLLAGAIAVLSACGNEDVQNLPGSELSAQLSSISGRGCTLQVNRAWDRSTGTAPQYPYDELPDTAYAPTSNGTVYAVNFSQDGTGVTVGQTPLVGVLQTTTDERKLFDLQDGTFAGGRFVVWTSGDRFEAELTIYGSGVPIIQSERGTVSGGDCQDGSCGLPSPRMACGNMLLFSSSDDVCDAMDAVAVGTEDGHCNCILGFAWNGSECMTLADCACEGSDCDKLTSSAEECQSQHSVCTLTPTTLTCGSPALHQNTHDVCEPMDITGQGICNCTSMGWMWNGSACVQLSDDFCTCVGSDCDKLTETLEECQNQHASCASTPNPYQCGSAALHQDAHNMCSAMDAVGSGECNCFIGFSWNGSSCVGLSGCSCAGDDCDRLTTSLADCQAQHDECD